MPTSTFFNLPTEKKEKLLRAIRDELARVPFEAVSINKIVQAAGIPRGSFYQYFADKSDMLQYILQDYKKQRVEVVKDSLKESGGDIFKMFTDIFDFTIDFASQETVSSFCKNLFSDLKINVGICSLHEKNQIIGDLTSEILPYINMEELNLHNDNDLANMLDILMGSVRDAIVEAFLDMNNHKKTRCSYVQKLELLKRGFLINKGDMI